MIGEIAKLNIGRIGGKIAERHRQRVSVECGIDICDGDDVAGADPEPQVHSRALTAATPQPDHLVDQSLAPQVSVRIRHSVSRAIIDDDDLQTAAVGEGLLGQTADTGAQRLGFVASSQDHAYGQIGIGELSWAFREGCDRAIAPIT